MSVEEPQKESWYERAECVEPLTQGDILLGIPVLCWKSAPITNHSNLKSLAEALSMDLIIMTQACDLLQENDRISDLV